MTPFLLLKLPHLPNKRIIRLMGAAEVTKLSMCSIRTENLVRLMKYEMDDLTINLNGNCSTLTLNLADGIEFVYKQRDFESKFRSRAEEIKFEAVDPIQDCFLDSKRLRSIFKIKNELLYMFFLPTIKSNNWKEFFAHHLIGEYHKVAVIDTMKKNDFLELELVTHLMDTMRLEAGIQINAFIPQGFRHEKAFKFRSIYYSDARWITMDDLKSIRNAETISFSGTQFGINDINEFLHYWINCEEDMFRSLIIGFEENVLINERTILNGLLYVRSIGQPIVFIKARENGKRKFVVGKLRFHAKYVELTTYNPIDQYDATYQTLQLWYKYQQLYAEKGELETEEQVGELNEMDIIRIRGRQEAIEIKLNAIRSEKYGRNFPIF